MDDRRCNGLSVLGCGLLVKSSGGCVVLEFHKVSVLITENP